MLDKLKKKVRLVRAELSVLAIAYRDKRTPLLSKVMLGLTIGYMLSPIDLIPDFIPILGLLDDLIIVPLFIKISIRLIPKEVLGDARKQVKNISQKRRKSNWLGAIVIIGIWAAILVLLYRWIRRV